MMMDRWGGVVGTVIMDEMVVRLKPPTLFGPF